jgi:hypothetical protein
VTLLVPTTEAATDTATFLELLWPLGVPEGEVLIITSQEPGRSLENAPASTVELAADLGAVAERLRVHCWLNVATRPAGIRGRGTKDESLTFPALWADLDVAEGAPEGIHDGAAVFATYGEAIAVLDRFLLRPTAIVRTGYGLSAWWMLDEPAPAAVVGPLIAGMKATMGRLSGNRADPNVYDLARMMRLPGTWNVKVPEAPRPVELVEVSEADRHSPRDFLEVLDAPPAEPPARATTERPLLSGADQRPGDAYNAEATTEGVVELLARHGAVEVGRYTTGDRTVVKMARPGKDPRSGLSLTVGWVGEAVTHVFTTGWPELPAGTHSPFGVLAHLEHGGDFAAAARALRLEGYGTSSTTPPPAPRLALPAEWWERRPELVRLRDAADARLVARPAHLAAVLCRTVAHLHHGIVLPPIIGGHASLNLGIVVLGDPGHGKSSAWSASAETVELHDTPGAGESVRSVRPGSGEGLVDAYMGQVPDPTDDKGKRMVRRQVRHRVLAWMDEGEALVAQGQRAGATVLPILRSALMGEDLSTHNATGERTREVPAHGYRLAFGVGFQYATALPFLTDATGGTPQRFLWVPAGAADLPELDALPDAPEPLVVTLPDALARDALPDVYLNGARHWVLPVAPEVVRAIRAEHHARMRDTKTDELAAHSNLLRLKVAAALELLAGRLGVTTEAWELAAPLVELSTACQRAVLDRAEWERANRAKEATDAHVRRQVAAACAAEEASEARALRSATRSAIRLVHRHHQDETHPEGTCPGRCITNAIAGKHRRLLGVAAVTEALAAGAITTESGERVWPTGDRWSAVEVSP